MKQYTKLYFSFFGYSRGDFIPCEICNSTAVDIHHIESRGRGGNPSGEKDAIENLMALCRADHEKYGDKKQHKEWLKEVHLNFMKQRTN